MKNRTRGFTLVEATIAMAIVATLLVAALRGAGAAGLLRFKTRERATGAALADGLMTEISRRQYQEPSGTPSFGPETGENATKKTTFDDVDDFNAWSESPPADADGIAMTGLAGWSRAVTVEWVNATAPAVVVNSETGVKRVTVTVKSGNTVAARRCALRTDAP